MSAEDFFSRWSKKNQEAHEAKAGQAEQAEPQPAPAPEADDPYAGRVPTQEDLDQLTPQSNISAFMQQGVDENVKRSALKKLFSDPHFNIMDGLDIYIDDYSKPDPIPPEMLAMLEHAKGLFNPAGLLDRPHMAMRSELDPQQELPQDLPPESPTPEAANDAAQEAAPLAPEAEQRAQSEQDLEPDPGSGPAPKPPSAPEQTAPERDNPPTEQHPAPPVAGNHTSGTHPETETRKP